MEDKTYTLNIHHPSKYDYSITIPEIEITTHSTVNLDSALMLASQAIEKHHKTRYLILVFNDTQYTKEAELTKTDLESQAAFEVTDLGIAPYCKGREVHLIFELSQPLTREQVKWLDRQEGKLFDRYFTKDEIEVSLDELKEQARKHRE